MMQVTKMGLLYVVATPIGNLQDMTWRAVEVLKGVDKIAAEDTRHTARLLKHFSIEKPMLALHDFNERERLESIILMLQQGESIALVSDAGTPLVSDPGFHLVQAAHGHGISVVAVPGACAAIAALSVAGLPTDRFTFEGFLPAKAEGRVQYLMALLHETRTMIFYEAPHRLQASLEAMKRVFGPERKAVVARELTKMFESTLALDLKGLCDYYANNEDKQRGEIVILLAGSKDEPAATTAINAESVLDILLAELPVKQAASLASKITGERKNVLYEMALQKKAKQ